MQHTQHTQQHERRFTIRAYECDAYGHLNNVNYIRLMQEAAISASDAVGWTMDRYAEAGCQWVVRQTDITYRRPVYYADTLRIVTWVGQFGRVQCRRNYQFFRMAASHADVSQAGSEPPTDADDLVAEAWSDWVYTDVNTLRPVRIPDAIVADFAAASPEPYRTEKLPDPPAFPPDGFTLPCRVEWRDVDVQSHANNAACFTYFEDYAVQVGRHMGWPLQRSLKEGFAMILRQMHVVYHQAAQLDDELIVRGWVSDLRRAMATRHYQLERPADGVVLARGRGLWICYDPASQRPLRMPDTFVNAFAAQASPDDPWHQRSTRTS